MMDPDGLKWFIERELAKDVWIEKAPVDALEKLFRGLYGTGASRESRIAFLRIAAPIARAIAFRVATTDVSLYPGMTVGGFRDRWALIEAIDPMAADLLELMCFANLSVEEAAGAMQIATSDAEARVAAAISMSARSTDGRRPESDASWLLPTYADEC